jgi:hypothetical protein
VITLQQIVAASRHYSEEHGHAPGGLVLNPTDALSLRFQLVEQRMYEPALDTVLGMTVHQRPDMARDVVIFCEADGSIPHSPFRIKPLLPDSGLDRIV